MMKLAYLSIFLLFPLNMTIQAADETALADVPEKSKGEEVSINTPEFFNLQKDYRNELKTIRGPINGKLKSLLQQYLKEADDLYGDKKKSGNIKGMAIARKTQSVFTKAIEDLQQNGEFKLPENVRKDLQETVDKCRLEQQGITKDLEGKIKELDENYQKKFADIIVGLLPVDQAQDKEYIAKKFQEFLTADIKISEQGNSPVAVNMAEMKELGIELPKQSEKPLSPVIAEKGTGGKWIDIAVWKGEMMGMDIVNIPVLNKAKDYNDTQYFPIADAESKLFYHAINSLPAHDNYAFRLQRVPDYRDVDVIEWPSKRNDWNLIVRTKAALDGEKLPLKHGFIFQVSLPDQEFKKLFRGKKIAKNAADLNTVKDRPDEKQAPPVRINISSLPKGAQVYVNGQLCRSTGKPLQTPCRVLVPAAGCNIKISLLGYFDKIYDNYIAKPEAEIKALLEKDNSIKFFSKNIVANAPGWTSSGVTVKPGDQVIIEAEGIWSCTKDKCGPEGIPNNAQNYKYYSNAAEDQRQITSVPYGALLMKLKDDKDETIRAVPGKISFSASKTAEILFDINEREGKTRKGNKGKLTVNIAVQSEK